nr:reverse transcriptase domain-containing protein [Virgibacillus sp. MSJ-26]
MRKLGIPTVVDRVVQQAITQKLSPIFERQFSEYSYGFRPGRSCEMAVIQALEYINDGYSWLVDIDLERFFDTVHHDKLMRIISHTIKDGDVISLIRKYLVSGVMVNGKYEDTPLGTPQGGNLSPLLSNIMLNELDKELEARELHFVRYADDSLIFVRSEKAANRVLISITKFIEKKLGLKVNVEKSRVSRSSKTKFLGFGFYYDTNKKNFQPRPHGKSVQKFQRKLRQLTKRKKNSKKRIKSLVKLGIPVEEAKGLTYCRKGYRFIGLSKVVQRALSNKHLRQRGIPFAQDYYLKVHTVI